MSNDLADRVVPFLPLLFTIAIKPLAISIRNHPDVAPLNLGGNDHRISLYADDVVLDPDFLTNLPFNIVTDKFKYLGVTIPKDPK